MTNTHVHLILFNLAFSKHLLNKLEVDAEYQSGKVTLGFGVGDKNGEPLGSSILGRRAILLFWYIARVICCIRNDICVSIIYMSMYIHLFRAHEIILIYQYLFQFFTFLRFLLQFFF